ncbi:MAG: choice-of-anchor D domain-containing protein, partial [Flavobacteriales bacterium]|nr:choice-of-anchor D domain-containing protein [Flavobacteriales bacterium]
GNSLTSTNLDAIVNQLDAFGLSDGTLTIAGNEDLSSAAQPAFDDLVGKGWTIDVDAPPAPGAQINITGNGIDIISSAAASAANGSDFESVIVGSPATNQFTIENTGDEDLIISVFSNANPTDFSITTPNLTIPAGGSETFDVTFNALSEGVKSGSLVIISNDVDLSDQIFVLLLSAEGVTVLPNQLMISQYYDGFNAGDKWIEVTNISGSDLPADSYFLALYDQTTARAGIIDSQAPDQSTAIPAMVAGEVLLFRNGTPALPLSGNIGTATQIDSPVCTFNLGDDVILISTTNDSDSYNNRVDIIGNVSTGPSQAPDPWGINVGYIKGGCSSEEAHIVFDANDWTLIGLGDVNNALASTNLALGTQVIGETSFDGSTWSNGDPDQTRTAIIATSFTGAANTFTACNLIINAGVDAIFDSNGATSNSIVLYGDLEVNGTLTIGDTETLVVFDNGASLGTITKIEKSTPLDNYLTDMTYWASPVEGSQLSTIFTGVAPDRIFDFRGGNENPVYAGTNYKYWWNSSGAMGRGKGYAAPGSAPGIQTLTFTGIPHKGAFTGGLWYSGTPDLGTANENFNMMGNPFPAAIDILKVMEDNGNVSEIALWTHGTEIDPDTGEYFDGDYVYFNSLGQSTDGVTKNISSGQGFMIRSLAFGNVTFSSSQLLVGQNTQFYKSQSSKAGNSDDQIADKLWLRLKLGTEKTDILVGFMDGATDGYDKYYDAIGNLYDSGISLIEKQTKFYSTIGADKFMIQELGAYGAGRTVGLGFDTKKTGWFKMSINKKQGAMNDSEIILVDTYLNIKHDLNKSDYEFEATKKGEFTDRFRLEFVNRNADLGDKELIDEGLFSVVNDFDMMKVNSGKLVNEIRVYDLLGRMIIQGTPGERSFELNTSSVRTGTIMLIEAKLEDGSMINTKSVKY